MLGRGNEITITVDPIREEAKSRQEEVRASAKNDGSGLREWMVEEGRGLSCSSRKSHCQSPSFGACINFSGAAGPPSRLTRGLGISGLMATERMIGEMGRPPIGGRRTARGPAAQHKATDPSPRAKTGMMRRALGMSLPWKVAFTVICTARS
jgi:hypothetical protein